MIDFIQVTGIQLDDGNLYKSAIKYGIALFEAKQAFFNNPLLVLADTAHGTDELHYHALRQTEEGRRLHISFTMRAEGTRIRILSARSMRKREKNCYAENT